MKIAYIPNRIKTNEHLNGDNNKRTQRSISPHLVLNLRIYPFRIFIIHAILIERIRIRIHETNIACNHDCDECLLDENCKCATWAKADKCFL